MCVVVLVEGGRVGKGMPVSQVCAQARRVFVGVSAAFLRARFDVMAGPTARFIIAQPIGLGDSEIKIMRAEGPFHQAMSRAFSPHDFVFLAFPDRWAGLL